MDLGHRRPAAGGRWGERMDSPLTKYALLASGLYESDGQRLVSRYYPPFNIVRARGRPNGRRLAGSRFSTPGRPHRVLHIDQRPLRLVTGDPSDLALDDVPHFGRIIDGLDLGKIYRGLRRHLLWPERRTWIIDEHHLLYYVLWEARALGLLPSPPRLVHFDAHHDAAPLAVDPPPGEDLSTHASYVMRHVRIGNHITALLHGGLVRSVRWVTHREELAYRRSDMERELAGRDDLFTAVHMDELPDGALGAGEEPLVVSLDWDFLTANYNGGLILEEVTPAHVDDFDRHWRRLGLAMDRIACLVIATSPGYAEEQSMLAGLPRFLARLA